RTLPQARALDETIGEDALDAVIVLTAPRDALVDRMLARGRADDTEASVRNRLAVYERETAPLVGFYQKRGIVMPVRGTGAIEEITGRILEVLAGLSRA
ncbi:MAG: nucleoside monophosphate kinase, partial [bacterium]|nr:nucleoside monophosphate kinase [bacterium]